MHVRSDAEQIVFQNWTLRVRPAAAEGARLLLLLHGWTGDENSMWVFARNFPPSLWILAPRALHPATPSGYSWRTSAAQRTGWPTLEDFRPSVQALIGLVDAYAAENALQADEFDVAGFSQGAALTAALAFLHPGRIQRAAVLSGFLPQGVEALADAQPLQGKRVFVAHGTLDDRVPIAAARLGVQILQQAGAEVALCEDAVGHKLSAACLRELESFLA